MAKQRTHTYKPSIEWRGNLGQGTRSYTAYGRNHVIRSPGKADLPASADPAFRGEATLYNPEDLFVASLASCHMLWYLHLCAEAGIVVESYADEPMGTMEEGGGVPGAFTAVVLRPMVKISSGIQELAITLHERAHQECFIANSVKVKVTIEASAVML